MRRSFFHKNLKTLSDTQLLDTFIKKGDVNYLGELYSRYLHLVYGVCLKYFKEPERSKDAVINIYEKIQTDINRYQVKNFKSWLHVVTKNYCLMELRKSSSGKLTFVSSDDELTHFMENVQDLHPIDTENRKEELEKALQECIEKLKQEQKRCIQLFYLQNKCYREISDELNTEEKKIKSFIQNGKRNLKICLERKNEQQ